MESDLECLPQERRKYVVMMITLVLTGKRPKRRQIQVRNPHASFGEAPHCSGVKRYVAGPPGPTISLVEGTIV